MLTLFTEHLQRRRLSQKTIRLRLFYLTKFAEHCRLDTATLRDLEDYVTSDANWSDNTRQTIVASLRTFYGWAHGYGHLESNPAAHLMRVKIHRKPSRIATDTAIREALCGATTTEKAMLLLGAECGLRVSEIAALHKSSRDGMWLNITGKGGHHRSLYCSPELAALLTEIESTSMRWGHYFPGKSGGSIHPSTVWKHIRRLADTNPHSLRHRAGSTVYRNTGNDIRVAQEFLGHASPVTTAVYVHVERADLVRASDASRIAA